MSDEELANTSNKVDEGSHQQETIKDPPQPFLKTQKTELEISKQLLKFAGMNFTAGLTPVMGSTAAITALVEIVGRQKVLSSEVQGMSSLFYPRVANSLTNWDGLSKMVADMTRPNHVLSELFANMGGSGAGFPNVATISMLQQAAFGSALDSNVAGFFASLSQLKHIPKLVGEPWHQQIWNDLRLASSAVEVLRQSATLIPFGEFGSLERFNAVRLYKATVLEDEETTLAESTEVLDLVHAEVYDSLEIALRTVDDRLVAMWQGARDAAKSVSADRTRQVAVSLREMTTQLLHMLAPDKQIKAWSKSSDDFHNGNPTRKARLRFIYSRFGPEVEEFFELDVESAIRWIELINKQTHTLEPFQTDAAVEALLMRFEGLALGLIRGSKGFE